MVLSSIKILGLYGRVAYKGIKPFLKRHLYFQEIYLKVSYNILHFYIVFHAWILMKVRIFQKQIISNLHIFQKINKIISEFWPRNGFFCFLKIYLRNCLTFHLYRLYYPGVGFSAFIPLMWVDFYYSFIHLMNECMHTW